MTKKLIDCFTFYNELDMLKFRLNYLHDIVDTFVIVEATLTHAGNEKELYFEKNKHLFEKHMDKIIHIIVNELPDKSVTGDAWVREKLQRNLIDRGINKLVLCDEDIIVISDVDEIPDIDTLSIVKNTQQIENICYSLEQDLYYYNLTCKSYKKWYHAKIVNYYTYKTRYNRMPDNIRMSGVYKTLNKGGWHLSYFGDVEFIKNKLQNFAHQEFNNELYTSDKYIENKIKNIESLFDNKNSDFRYCKIEENTYLPSTYKELIEFFQ